MTRFIVKTETIYAPSDVEYDAKLNELAAEGWEPFASEYQQDGFYKVRLRCPAPVDLVEVYGGGVTTER